MNKPTGKLLFAYQSIANLEERLKASEARCAELRSALEGMVEYFPDGYSDGECFSVEKAKAVLAQSKPAKPKCPDCGHDNVLCACGYKS